MAPFQGKPATMLKEHSSSLCSLWRDNVKGSKRKAGLKEKDPAETYMKAGRRGGRTSDRASALGRRRDRFSEVVKEVRRDLDIEGREIGKFKAKDFTLWS